MAQPRPELLVQFELFFKGAVVPLAGGLPATRRVIGGPEGLPMRCPSPAPAVNAMRGHCRGVFGARRFGRIVVAPLMALVLLAPAAGAATYDVDASHTSIYFAVAHRDISFVRGRFGKISARVDFDADAKSGTITVDVDPASVDTGNATLDGILSSAQFLDANAYPGVRFVSERLVFEGGVLSAVEGTLLLHGVQRPATLTADRFVCREVAFGLLRQHVCGGAFHATLRRSEFGITRYAGDVGDMVLLEINVEGVRK